MGTQCKGLWLIVGDGQRISCKPEEAFASPDGAGDPAVFGPPVLAYIVHAL